MNQVLRNQPTFPAMLSPFNIFHFPRAVHSMEFILQAWTQVFSTLFPPSPSPFLNKDIYISLSLSLSHARPRALARSFFLSLSLSLSMSTGRVAARVVVWLTIFVYVFSLAPVVLRGAWGWGAGVLDARRSSCVLLCYWGVNCAAQQSRAVLAVLLFLLYAMLL